jgi:hypothetical protein
MIGQASVEVTPDGYLVTRSDGDTDTWTPSGRPGHFEAVDGPETTDFAIHGGKAVQWYQQGGIASFIRVGPLYQRNVLLLVALLASVAAAATLMGAALCWRSASPSTNMQRRLDGAQRLAAAAWLIALGAAAVFGSGAGDKARLVFDWPGVPLLIASSAALFASLLSAGILTSLPFACMEDAGWGRWRKLRFSTTNILFCALGLQLALWGFLQPWAA